MTELHALLAQTTRPAPGGGVGTMFRSLWFPIILMLAVFYFMLYRGQSKEKKKKQQMLDQVKKNDRVMTIGGVIGTVVGVKETEITLKVDETTNTKMTFSRQAIQKVLTAEETVGGSEK